MNKSRLRPISDKQAVKNKHWKETSDLKAYNLGFKCQWCGGLGVRIWNENHWEYLSGHHIIKRRFNIHTYDNCYICHELPCHSFIEDNNVDVAIHKNKGEYEAYLISLWG